MKINLENLLSAARKLSEEIITRSSGKGKLTQRGEEGLLLSLVKAGFAKLRGQRPQLSWHLAVYSHLNFSGVYSCPLMPYDVRESTGL